MPRSPPLPTPHSSSPSSCDPTISYAPASNPSRFERQYNALQARHDTLQHELDVLHADIRLRMFLLNIVPQGEMAPTKEQVEEWVRMVKQPTR